MTCKEPTTYPIYERFNAFQGEGMHAGRNAFFIRTFGCPVHCPWCDSAGTWHKNYVPKPGENGIEKLTPATLAREAVGADPKFVVLTGGEPTVHNLNPLVDEIRPMSALPVHLETCGGFDLHGVQFDHITLSPKREKEVRQDMFDMADEFKLIIDTPTALSRWLVDLRKMREASENPGMDVPVYLHPEWSVRDEDWVKELISEAVAKKYEKGFELRAGYQLHKLFNCDALDKRSRPLVPLGGDPNRGF